MYTRPYAHITCITNENGLNFQKYTGLIGKGCSINIQDVFDVCE